MEKNKTPEDFINDVNRIKWNSAVSITPFAQSLVDLHIKNMKNAIDYIKNKMNYSPLEAYDFILTGATQITGYNELIKILFEKGQFRNALAREHLILVLASYYIWEKDPVLKSLENAWEPVYQLYNSGYVSSFEDDDVSQIIYFILIFNNTREKVILYN